MASAPPERATGLFHPQPRPAVIEDLVARSRRRLTEMSAADRQARLEDALWNERNRIGRSGGDEDERDHLDSLARALVRGGADAQIDAGLSLVADWADEIHGRFDPRVYQLATRAMPRALSGLLRPNPLRSLSGGSSNRVVVKGNLDVLQTLAKEATLILCPTHVSNLDSPLIGLALYLAKLPPFVYGAGLNLFDNPILGWWMHRLGAYTVDRKKRASLYKDVLKDYSIRALATHHHSLFFPGGTRSRSGEIEDHLKKGLLGTGIAAWQEMLSAGRPDAEVYVVPLTLSFTLTLEANTLIEDHLAEAGKQRYIITDDEFAQPRRLASFARRVLDLDAAVVAHFGDPLDVLGRRVSHDVGERQDQALQRRDFVCDAAGQVQWDTQRDRVYTDRLADALVDAFPCYAEVLATHVVAYSAWRCLEAAVGADDPFRLVRVPPDRRRLQPEALLSMLTQTLGRAREAVDAGRCGAVVAGDAAAVLEIALDRFGRYHRSRALVRRGTELVVEDPRLCLYYRNRLTFLDRATSGLGGDA